uniref:Ig-like domain-containing protein n=1 Tax=Esox lucius TaxID=8010 RepID=A0A3P8YGA3_ESOLU
MNITFTCIKECLCHSTYRSTLTHRHTLTHSLSHTHTQHSCPIIETTVFITFPAKDVASPQMSSHPIIGIVGKSILLPCKLNSSTPIDLQTLILHWISKPNDQVVHAFNKGREDNSHQDVTYRNRTQIFQDQLPSGNFSLLLKDLKVDDDQTAFFLFHRQEYKSGHEIIQDKKLCLTNVKVAKSFQTPVVMINYEDRKAECSSTGGYPEPTLTWTDQNSVLDQDIPQIIRVPESGTFNISSTVNITENQILTCAIFNPTLNETLITTQTTTQNTNPSNNVSGIVIGFAIGALLFVVCIVAYRYIK